MADSGRRSIWLSGGDMFASSNTLPEHHSTLALLQQLDHAWFEDNLLKPRVGLIDAFLPSSPPLSPYKSIELMDAGRSKWAASPFPEPPRSGRMPCARFESLSRTLTPDSGSSALDGCKSAQEPDHYPHQPPQGAHARVSHQHVCARLRTNTVHISPAALQAWSAKDLRDPKELEVNENFQAQNLKSVDRGKQLRVSLVDGQLPRPSLRVLGTKRAQRKSSKSMTELEFDELQGFMDLGFHFSRDDLTPRIVSMFPALRHKDEEAGGSKRSPRTVLTIKPKQNSVATWLVRQSSSPLRRWQIPATSEDMKEHLKFWARAVASTVRQEC